jgi:hypothetical protein
MALFLRIEFVQITEHTKMDLFQKYVIPTKDGQPTWRM